MSPTFQYQVNAHADSYLVFLYQFYLSCEGSKNIIINKVAYLIHPRTGRGLITTVSNGFGIGRTGTRIVVLIIFF